MDERFRNEDGVRRKRGRRKCRRFIPAAFEALLAMSVALYEEPSSGRRSCTFMSVAKPHAMSIAARSDHWADQRVRRSDVSVAGVATGASTRVAVALRPRGVVS